MSLAERISSVRNIPWASIQKLGSPLNRIPKQKEINQEELLELLIFLKDYDKAYSHTPDWLSMEEQDVQPVFVYCNVQYRGAEHNVIQNIIKLKDDDGNYQRPYYAFTRECYEVWQTRDGPLSIPVALTSRASQPNLESAKLITTFPRANILRGRVYLIRAEDMNVLDTHKRHGIIHSRKKIRIQIPIPHHFVDKDGCPFCLEEIRYTNAWAYLGKHKYWDNHLDGGFALDTCRLHDYRPTSKKSDKLGASQPFYYFNAAKVARGDFT